MIRNTQDITKMIKKYNQLKICCSNEKKGQFWACSIVEHIPNKQTVNKFKETSTHLFNNIKMILYQALYKASQSKRILLNVPRTLIRGFGFEQILIMQTRRGWVRFKTVTDPNSSLVQPLLAKTKTKHWFLPSGASISTLMQQHPDILFQQFSNHQQQLQVIWTVPVSILGILKTPVSVQQVQIKDKEVFNTLWLIKGVLQDYLNPRRLKELSLFFISDSLGKWKFIGVKTYKIEPEQNFFQSFSRSESQRPSPRSKSTPRKIQTPRLKKRLLMKTPDRHPPHIPNRMRKKQAELDSEIDQMISKENIAGLKHITYSSRQKYSQQSVKIDPLDLSFAKRIVQHKSRIQKRTQKNKEELGELLAIMKELTHNEGSTETQVLNKTVKFLLANPETQSSYLRQDSFFKRAVEIKKRSIPTPTAQEVINQAAAQLDGMVNRTRSVMR